MKKTTQNLVNILEKSGEQIIKNIICSFVIILAPVDVTTSSRK